MAIPAASGDLERRKYVRLRIRPDLSITPQRYEGRSYYVVKDPVSLRYYRFKEQEYFLLGLMDGKHTLDDAQKAFEGRFRPDRLTLEDLEHFGQQLLTAGLVQNESPQAGTLLFERRSKRRKSELVQMFTNILYIKIPVIDPDRILTYMLKYFSWIFTVWFLFLSLAVMGAAVGLVATHFETFMGKLPSYHEFFSFKTAIYLWIALGVVKIIHEFGHGLSCKAFGGEVHEMGFLLLCLSPAMYCNVSDSWTLPNKWHRIIIGAAGIYVEMMIAAFATFVWWNTPSQPFINNLSLSLMIVCSVSTIVFNGNPLMRYDGYYVLADWLEIPNLRDRANRYISNLFQEVCMGIETQPEPYMEPGRKVLFLIYAVVSYVYRWVVTFFILQFMASFLAPYKLEIVSNILALGALASMVGWPLYRMGKNLVRRGRLPDMKSGRLLVTAFVGALLILGFFLVPLPVTRIRDHGVVQFHPEHVTQMFVATDAVLKKVHVKEGETVAAGKVLAEFENLELDKKMIETKATIATKQKLLELYEEKRFGARDPRDEERLKQSVQQALGEKKLAEVGLEAIMIERSHLVLRAPRAGVVVGLPNIDEVGRAWERGQDAPFCSIGDRSKLRVLLPVHPADMKTMRDEFKQHNNSRTIPATIRVQGRVGSLWKGSVAPHDLPKSEAQEIPLPLSSRGGGHIAVRPPTASQKLIPQGQIYLVPVTFDDPDEAVCTNTMAQVKIHCEYRSAAWWTWRTLSSVFDLGLMG
ncbi:MAG: site-2 protease family protein [Planctomycetota bacterium]